MFSDGVERALRASYAAHEGQFRKGTLPVPYVLHPIHVSLLLARCGYDDEVLQAAILHDVVEDCDDWTIGRVESEFGTRVAGIVDELTEDKSLGWEARKRGAIESVPRLSDEAAAVKAGDKLHNLQSLLQDLAGASVRAEVWAEFTGGRESTLRMSKELVQALEARVDARLTRPLREVLHALLELEGDSTDG